MPRLTRVRRATTADVAGMAALIASAGLPPLFIEEHLDGFLLVERDGARLACGGVELYGNCAVLRSVVVAEEARGRGLGRRLADALIARARAGGVTELYLFTQDAHAFWQHLGFADVALDDWAQPARASWQYRFISVSRNTDTFAGIHSMRRAA
ncbi:MAG: GNAT family N-acetyltransferase [Chloroflexota bacterium]|nr:GNAT family N-acetyltransferase [Chloroflexota bacterium]